MSIAMDASVAVTRPVNLHSIRASCPPSGNFLVGQNRYEESTRLPKPRRPRVHAVEAPVLR